MNGNVAVVTVGGTDLSYYFTTANVARSRDTKEVTPLGSNPVRQSVGPLKKTFSGEGELDPAVDAVIGAAMDAEPPAALVITHTFNGISDTDSYYISSYEKDTPGDDTATFTIEAVLAI
jgi:hypothetical protein